MGTPGRGADVLIHRLKVAGLLSFGPDGIDLPLKPLNVLIGPNGSGKSNTLLAGGDAEAGAVQVREVIAIARRFGVADAVRDSPSS